MASVKLSSHALKDLKEIDQVIGKRIIEKLMWLEQNFESLIPERLHRELKDLYKLRIGDYRAIYSVHKDIITIEAVGHRRDVYR